MIDLAKIERRIFRIGIVLSAVGFAGTSVLFGLIAGLSCLGGAALGGLNLAWLRYAVNAAFDKDPAKSKGRIIAGFFLRLMLIPLTLYAMIRLLYFSVPAAVAGFAIFNCSIFVEGILEAFENSSGKA